MTGIEKQKTQKPAFSGSLQFKYYIHDTAAGYSFQMSGPFTEAAVAEIACCWQTAKSTLRGRILTLDVRGLTSVDESARQWLALMTREGARCLPEAFMMEAAAHPKAAVVETSKQTFFARLFSFWSPAPRPTR